MNTMDRPVLQGLTASGKERRLQPIVRKVLGLVIGCTYTLTYDPMRNQLRGCIFKRPCSSASTWSSCG